MKTQHTNVVKLLKLIPISSQNYTYHVKSDAGDVRRCHGDDVVDGQLAHLQQRVADVVAR